MLNRKIRVLLVDDHALVRSGVRLMLGTADDIEVTGEAESASEAMRLAKEKLFDVALIDLALPKGKSGLELIKVLKEEQPKLAVLMLSMYSEDVYAVRALKQGAAGYLTKNCSTSVLVSAVRKVASGGKYISPSFAEKLVQFMHTDETKPHDTLSDRELEVLRLIAAGESLSGIAKALHLSPSTVTTYRTRVLEKTGLKSNAKLAIYAIENGLI